MVCGAVYCLTRRGRDLAGVQPTRGHTAELLACGVPSEGLGPLPEQLGGGGGHDASVRGLKQVFPPSPPRRTDRGHTLYR
jgi:hypothetical protein